jgi:hypothetical protein
MCTLVGVAERKGKPLSDAEKVARDHTEKELKKVKTEQAGEEAGAQHTDVSGVLFTPKKKPAK